MKWFKHFSDASTSKSLESLILDLGFEGYGRYWHLLEMLAYEFDGDNTTFEFRSASIRESLRIRSWNKLETFVERIGNVRGMKTEYSRNIIKIEAPILLELQDRDFKKARKGREQNAPKEIDIEIDIDIEKNNKKVSAFSLSEFQINEIKTAWKEAAGHSRMGKGLERAKKLFTSQKKLNEFLLATKNYGEVLKIQSWRAPKDTLCTFIGTQQSTFFYRDYIDQGCIEEARSVEAKKGSKKSSEPMDYSFLTEDESA